MTNTWHSLLGRHPNLGVAEFCMLAYANCAAPDPREHDRIVRLVCRTVRDPAERRVALAHLRSISAGGQS